MIYLFFALIITITVMNMLVGVLVGVVQTVGDVEREQMMVQFVRATILNTLRTMNVDTDNNGMINQEEFSYLVQEPIAIRSFDQMGVDVVGLCDLADYIFADGRELPFAAFMELVMELRGSNHATVKDVVDLRKFFLLELRRTQDELEEILESLQGLNQTTERIRRDAKTKKH